MFDTIPRCGRTRRAGAALACLLTLCAAGLDRPATAAAAGCSAHPWCNRALAPTRRAGMVLASMTQAEKLALVAGGQAGDPRLGIPPLAFIDGPNGVGESSTGVTALPDAETVAASWDTSLARDYGLVLGAEAAGKGDTLIAAPTINIVRTANWGREAETLGEDPFLTGTLVAPEIRGIQDRHVIAQVKHFAGNNQELDRIGATLGAPAVSDSVSQRALQEIYFPGFRAAVQQGHVGSVMCSYNRLNGAYSCQNPATLGALKGFGLAGFVGPDALLAVRDSVSAATAGVDNFQLGSLASATGSSELSILTSAVGSGAISAPRLDDMARRVLVAMFAVGLFDNRPPGNAGSVVSTPAHRRLATRIAEQATVLLRNRGGVLPLGDAGSSIAVIGHDAGAGTQIEENGSPAVLHGPVITPLHGIRARAGRHVRVSYAAGTLGDVPLPVIGSRSLTPRIGSGSGLTAAYYAGPDLTGRPVLSRAVPTVDFQSKPAPLTPIPGTPGAQSARFTGTLDPPSTGTYRFSLTVAGVARLFLGGRAVVSGNAEFYRADLPGGIVTSRGSQTVSFQGLAHLTRHHPVSLRIDYSTGPSIAGAGLHVGWQPPDPPLLARAVRTAHRARVAIVFADDVTSEGMDRTSLALPGDQNRLIEAVASANPRTIVVLHTAGPVLMPWLPKVAAVIEAWYPGQQSGAAIAATLFGDSDPSARLPVTFPSSASQGPTTKPAEYPGIDNVAHYSEGILVGYRYYDRFGQRPLFPFGYGLSYTRFSLDRLRVSSSRAGHLDVRVRVANIGTRRGAEVVELYVGDPLSTGEPPRQLKGFAKVFLEPGRSRTVQIALGPTSFETFDQAKRRFVVVPGRYRIYVGTSSRALPLSTAVRLG